MVERGEGNDSDVDVSVRGVTPEADWMAEALASLGFRVERRQEGLDDGEDPVVEAEGAEASAVEAAVGTVRAPEALFFDVDGVLVDVSDSYREAIRRTAAEWGVELTAETISRAKAEGEANNDWVLLQRLLAREGVDAELESIEEVYEEFYQGTEERDGLWRREELLVEPAQLAAAGGELPVGAVTGRPRRDAERLFENSGLGDVLEAAVVMEDAPQKPRPDPVELLAERIGVERAWMIGDTPDDVVAAREAGVLPFGIVAPDEEEDVMREALRRAGAVRVVEGLDEFVAHLPELPDQAGDEDDEQA